MKWVKLDLVCGWGAKNGDFILDFMQNILKLVILVYNEGSGSQKWRFYTRFYAKFIKIGYISLWEHIDENNHFPGDTQWCNFTYNDYVKLWKSIC